VRKIVLNNTNKPVLFEFDNAVVSKTGFTTPAGWCVAMVVEQNGDRYIVIVLGARNKIERFDKVKDMLYNHINDNQLPSDKP
jgi:D-alanyl-D-alanine carboxypeptidase